MQHQVVSVLVQKINGNLFPKITATFFRLLVYFLATENNYPPGITVQFLEQNYLPYNHTSVQFYCIILRLIIAPKVAPSSTTLPSASSFESLSWAGASGLNELATYVLSVYLGYSAKFVQPCRIN